LLNWFALEREKRSFSRRKKWNENEMISTEGISLYSRFPGFDKNNW